MKTTTHLPCLVLSLLLVFKCPYHSLTSELIYKCPYHSLTSELIYKCPYHSLTSELIFKINNESLKYYAVVTKVKTLSGERKITER